MKGDRAAEPCRACALGTRDQRRVVAGPAVPQHDGLGPTGLPGDILAVGFVVFHKEILDEQWNVLDALGERRMRI